MITNSYWDLVSGQVHTPEQIGQIVVKTSADRSSDSRRRYFLVAPSVAPVYTVVTANGKPAVLLSINRQPDSNTLSVADEVHSEDRRVANHVAAPAYIWSRSTISPPSFMIPSLACAMQYCSGCCFRPQYWFCSCAIGARLWSRAW